MAGESEDALRSFATRAEAHTQRALQLSAEIEAVAVEAQSPGGEVTVRINSAGGLADLQLHAQSDGLSRDELAHLVLTTSRHAQAKLARRVDELVSRMYGPDSGTASLVSGAYAGMYAKTEDEQGRTDGH